MPMFVIQLKSQPGRHLNSTFLSVFSYKCIQGTGGYTLILYRVGSFFLSALISDLYSS